MAKKQKQSVDEFMAALDHPLKAEVEAVRAIIRGVDAGISEQIKWNAPSYFYKGIDTVTFNLWAKDKVHLVFHFPMVVSIESPILEGDYPTRRMAFFNDMAEIEAKRGELERVVARIVALIEEPPIGG